MCFLKRQQNESGHEKRNTIDKTLGVADDQKYEAVYDDFTWEQLRPQQQIETAANMSVYLQFVLLVGKCGFKPKRVKQTGKCGFLIGFDFCVVSFREIFFISQLTINFFRSECSTGQRHQGSVF